MEHSRKKDQILIAHRGCRDQYPENTLIAFQAALDIQADMIELDVALTRDKRLVVIHDDTVDRTTNGTGFVKNLSLREIKRLDAGGWFDPTFKDCRVPELCEVLDLVKDKIEINIEIKASFFEETQSDVNIESKVVSLVNEKKLLNSVIISSFEIRYLERLAKLKTPPRLAYLTETPLDELSLDRLKRVNAYSWHPLFEILTKDQVELACKNGFKIFPFTVNTTPEYEDMLEMGVDGVFTDHVEQLRISSSV